MSTTRFQTMRAITLPALLLIALPGIAMAQPGQPSAPMLPAPLYAPPAQAPSLPGSQPNGVPLPAILPGANGLYNVLTYGQRGAHCTPSLLTPTACR